MSSIFGLLRLDGQSAASSDLERMGATMPYRSPDRRKVRVLGPAGLGHGLMRVTLEDWHDDQPLTDPAAPVTIVADVRLDNREDLAELLDIPPDRLETMADSALVLAAYGRWGETLTDHLLGDFAFAIWDGRAEKLVLGRDHMGQRTLFYTRTANVFAFATDLQALWAIEGTSRRISEEAIGRRLLNAPGGTPGATFYEDIFGLTGGMRLTIGTDQPLVRHRYWRPKADPVHEGRDEAYYVATYRRLIREAVVCRLRRNRKPAALMLSGGYDSATIASLAREVLEPQGRKLIAVASVLAEGRDDARFNARRWVEVCRRHMPHLDVRYFVRHSETMLSRLDDGMITTSLPGSETHFIRAALFDLAAAAGAQVIMDGHGGDYTVNPRGFGSLAYLLRTGRFHLAPRHALGEARWRQLPVSTVVAQAVRQSIPSWLIALKRRVQRMGRPAWSDYMIAEPLARRLFGEGRVSVGEMRERPREAWRMRAVHAEILDQQNSHSAAAVPVAPGSRGLEFTMPFHDKRIVEFGLAIPQTLYAKGGRNRYLAHQALEDVLPPEFKSRPWGGNDALDPDFMAMVDGVSDDLAAAINSMFDDASLAGYLDLIKLRQALRADEDGGGVGARLRAVRAVLVGKFLQWSNQRNL